MFEDLDIGDELKIRINEGSDDSPYYVEATVQIIGIGNGDSQDDSVLCYVPDHYSIKRSFKLGRLHQKHYSFSDKFLSEWGMFVHAYSEVTKHLPQIRGETCDNCGEFFEYAEKCDDAVFTCYQCKQNPFR